MPFFTKWAGLSVTQVMFLQSWCMLWAFLSEIPTGGIADKFGRKFSIQLGIICQIIGFGVYVIFPNFIVYLFCEAFLGISLSLMSGADDAFVYDTLKKHNQEKNAPSVFSKSESVGIAGIMIAAPIGSIIAGYLGYASTIILMVIPLSISLIMISTLKEPEVKSKHEKKNYFKIIRDGIKVFHSGKILKILAWDVITMTTIGFILIFFYQLLLSKINVGTQYFGLVNTAFVLLEIIFLSTYSKMEKFLNSKKMLLFLSILISGICIILSSITDNHWIAIPAICIALAFTMTRKPLMSGYMNSYIPSSERATVISTISSFISFSRMIFYPIFGFISEINLNYAFWILGAILIVFAFISEVKEEHLT